MSISSLQAELRSYRDASSRASGDIAAETFAISAIDAQLLGKNVQLLQAKGVGLRTFSCTSYTGRRRDARYSSGVIHPSPCEILPERNHRIQESRAPMNSPRAAPLQSRA